MKNKISILIASSLLSTSLCAIEWGMSTGIQDFVVQNIVDDNANDGISAGDSHTAGVSIGMYLNHTNQYGVNFALKGETFIDHDTDHLDPDHIPVWFKFSLGANGPIIKINDNNSFKWHIFMDNMQNTVSCVERRIRQNYGVGYNFNGAGFTLDAKLYAGFYYIELDDDTPVNRGYTRQETDDGEAANMFEVVMSYKLSEKWFMEGSFKNYQSNAGFEKLETDYSALVTYQNDWFGEGSSLNLSAEYNKYDLSRFYRPSVGVAIVPFDNDMLVQAYVTIPFND